MILMRKLFFFNFDKSNLNVEIISCVSRQYLLIGSKKHAYVSPDSINEIKKAANITLLFLQLK